MDEQSKPLSLEELFDEFVGGFESRKFSAGLLVAFIDFLIRLGVPESSIHSYEELLATFPRQTETAAGKRANTLIVKVGETTVSLRPAYNNVESFFRAEHKRFDYPSCAPHATQAWGDYIRWINSLCSYTRNDLNAIRARVCDFVLKQLPSHAFAEGSIPVDPPLFERLLTSFDLAAKKGEKTGAALQGLVFGFLRADNPHLQIEISKVRTGSKRLQRVGDVDAWEGKRLAISAEVKQFHFRIENVPDVAGFANDTQRRSAIGIVFALDFDFNARDALASQGVQTVSLAEMQQIVELWDSMKQRTAVASMAYYVHHVEKNGPLGERLDEFLKEAMKP